MNHASLFSGLGGFDLAAQWMGWNNVLNCENNEFCRRILKYYWPNAISYGDIKETDFTIHRGQIDVLSGGFPCQPFSAAGKRKGTEDDRYLWPHMRRAIREIQPRWVVGENVYGIINWSGGLVFNQVCSDLEAEGYEVWSVILPACGKNAPHKRDRVWFVAHSINGRYSKHPGKKKKKGEIQSKCRKKRQSGIVDRTTRDDWNVANSKSDRIQRDWSKGKQKPEAQIEKEIFGRDNRRNYWDRFPNQSPVCGGNDGLPSKLDGITFPKWRNESIKGFGNAVVPQIPFEIFKVIEQMDRR